MVKTPGVTVTSPPEAPRCWPLESYRGGRDPGCRLLLASHPGWKPACTAGDSGQKPGRPAKGSAVIQTGVQETPPEQAGGPHALILSLPHS